MPRNPGTGQYSKPIPNAIPNTTIASAPYNLNVDDVVVDLNLPRPVVTGGTGASSAFDARYNLSTEVSNQVVVNYDMQVWESGSFISAAGAIAAPNGNAFNGLSIVYGTDQNWVVLVARDLYDAQVPGRTYTREKRGGVWTSWIVSDQAATDLANTKVAKTGDTMTGHLRINELNPELILETSTGSAAANDIYGKVFGSTRWILRLGDGLAETGGDAGSNFAVYRYDTAGAFLDVPLTITRLDGRLAIPNGFTASNSNFSGAVVWAGATVASAPGVYNGSLGGIFGDASGGYMSVSRSSGPAYFCNVNNDGAAIIFERSGVQCGSIGVTATTTSYYTVSNASLKEDLRPFTASGVILDATTVYDFCWKATGDRGHGVLAQQTIGVYPEAVTYDKERDWWGVDYSKFVPLLLAEVKALRGRVAQLETMLDKLI